MQRFNQSTVNLINAADTVLLKLVVRNCEIPLPVLQPLFLHKIRKEAAPWLDLAKHDVIHLHLVGLRADGLVGGMVVGMDPRIQMITRASVAHGHTALQFLLDQLVPRNPLAQLYFPVCGAKCPTNFPEMCRNLVSTFQEECVPFGLMIILLGGAVARGVLHAAPRSDAWRRELMRYRAVVRGGAS
jgi:hypothetical protein